MIDELPYYSYLGSSAVIALVASAVLWRRQRKQSIDFGFSRFLIVSVAAFTACFVSLVALVLLARRLGFQNVDRFMQPLWIISSVIAYLAGGGLVVLLRKRAANAQH
jgi:hypothetical protein